MSKKTEEIMEELYEIVDKSGTGSDPDTQEFMKHVRELTEMLFG